MKTIAQLMLMFAFTSFVFAADNARERQVDDIREAVFRYQFDHNASGQQKTAKVYFLQVGEKSNDPAEGFMKRFDGNKPPVRVGSAAKNVPGKGLLDKKTGEEGLSFSVVSIKWISDTEVEVEGGYYEASLSASCNTYTVVKKNGKWVVTKTH